MVDLRALLDDLRAEHEELDDILAGIGAPQWDTPTPAVGWTVRDQVSHLAFFDESATLAVRSPDAFMAGLSDLTDLATYMQAPLDSGRAMPPGEVLALWRAARAAMLDAFEGLEPTDRVVWYGPPMSAASFISARLMETWAHGQDVVDALGIHRSPTARLRHVAHLGVRARGYSYTVNGATQPDGEVAVRLTAPDGSTWEWGTSETDSIEGRAEDFCLLVTQRRHVADTGLVVTGRLAREWVVIAQCFAGPPGEGRKPGQFAVLT